ncbi:hypothetical protein M0813_24734 [Anaeramoeba flamelloides]|uniref:Uncharacterized protein n=1 Tax=Anaeramoeba flamelloides TaxID=1746091 RepID=A0ABQ8Y5D0_9EUKA|nr:hypothetical protein M0813_24734 [Anaeramoeba flamelloides]
MLRDRSFKRIKKSKIKDEYCISELARTIQTRKFKRSPFVPKFLKFALSPFFDIKDTKNQPLKKIVHHSTWNMKIRTQLINYQRKDLKKSIDTAVDNLKLFQSKKKNRFFSFKENYRNLTIHKKNTNLSQKVQTKTPNEIELSDLTDSGSMEKDLTIEIENKIEEYNQIINTTYYNIQLIKNTKKHRKVLMTQISENSLIPNIETEISILQSQKDLPIVSIENTLKKLENENDNQLMAADFEDLDFLYTHVVKINEFIKKEETQQLVSEDPDLDQLSQDSDDSLQLNRHDHINPNNMDIEDPFENAGIGFGSDLSEHENFPDDDSMVIEEFEDFQQEKIKEKDESRKNTVDQLFPYENNKNKKENRVKNVKEKKKIISNISLYNLPQRKQNNEKKKMGNNRFKLKVYKTDLIIKKVLSNYKNIKGNKPLFFKIFERFNTINTEMKISEYINNLYYKNYLIENNFSIFYPKPIRKKKIDLEEVENYYDSVSLINTTERDPGLILKNNHKNNKYSHNMEETDELANKKKKNINNEENTDSMEIIKTQGQTNIDRDRVLDNPDFENEMDFGVGGNSDYENYEGEHLGSTNPTIKDQLVKNSHSKNVSIGFLNILSLQQKEIWYSSFTIMDTSHILSRLIVENNYPIENETIIFDFNELLMKPVFNTNKKRTSIQKLFLSFLMIAHHHNIRNKYTDIGAFENLSKNKYWRKLEIFLKLDYENNLMLLHTFLRKDLLKKIK